MLIPTKILVPTDFSEHSDRAFGQALDIVKDYSSKVFLLHVIHEAFLPVRPHFTKRNSTVNQGWSNTLGKGNISRTISGAFRKPKRLRWRRMSARVSLTRRY